MQVPELEFPCDYPIKVIGDSSVDFAAVIGAIVVEHVQGFDTTTIIEQASRNGNFVSLRIKFRAESRIQLDTLHKALIDSGRVKMVI
jgi:hypothetical protein